ncbi:hypothetical protein K1719_042140 [Acacia pycnantha]|nr:hypothetical protein K1719_042140 [Acacia pycnantha]
MRSKYSFVDNDGEAATARMVGPLLICELIFLAWPAEIMPHSSLRLCPMGYLRSGLPFFIDLMKVRISLVTTAATKKQQRGSCAGSVKLLLRHVSVDSQNLMQFSLVSLLLNERLKN